MMNESTVAFTPAEVSLIGFYFHGSIQVLSIVFIGIPLTYSEICIAQYTNCNIINMWDFFPLFRYVGVGTIYLNVLKTIYLLVLTSWYLEYSFFAAIDPPPWYSCAEFNDTKCMVKSVNVTVFQHCIEAVSQFDDDCGMKTASKCFFDREIGDNNTMSSINCLLPWKTLVASTTVSLLIFFLSIKKEKFIQLLAKLSAAYVCVVLIILFCVALSTRGTWYAIISTSDWSNITFYNCMHSINRGILSIGAGCGIIAFLSRDVSFRSPATMTSVSISLLTVFISFLFTLIAFSGIKTMIYFHGQEPKVIEMGSSVFFTVFACITEIMNYFDAIQLWSFAWFSAIFFCIFVNLWILHLFLRDLLIEIELAQGYKNLVSAIILIAISFLSWPFFCSDLTAVLTDATEIMQITNSFLFSFSLYWMYGFKNHNIDIIFMIGVKASYFWKMCWLLSPVFHGVMLYARWDTLEINEFENSYYIKALNMQCNLLVIYIILAIYHGIIFLGILLQIYFYYSRGEIREIFSPTVDWGPRDKILYKSRKMFVPEIMTTEFLYRQVRVRGYGQVKCFRKKTVQRTYNESSSDVVEWSALTSN